VASILRESRLSRRWTELLLISFVVVAGAATGLASAKSAKLGTIAVAALVVMMLTARRPVTLAVVAFAGVFAVQRLGGSSFAPGSTGGLSYSDALLAAAVVLAVPALIGTAQLPRLRVALQGTAVYLALLLPSLIANSANRVYLEWTHRLVMLAGSLLVGAWIARERRAKEALRLLTLVACVVSADEIVNWARNGFTAATAFHLNKNFIGAILSGVVVLLVIASRYLAVRASVRIFAILLVACGLLVSHSRGSYLAAALGLLVAFMMNPRAHSPKVRAGASLVAAVLAIFAYVSISDQFHQGKEQFNNSSAGTRYKVEKVAHQIWRSQPIVGVGLKYFNTQDYGPYAFAPNNVVDNELAESGLFGLGGFVVLQVMAVAAGWRRRAEPLVAVAVGMVLGQLLHGMVDIYWTAGTVSLPFLMLGLALGREPATPGDTGEHARWQRLRDVVASRPDATTSVTTTAQP
jgi:hypothetical protein